GLPFCEHNRPFILSVAGLDRGHFGLFHGLDLAPIVRRRFSAAIAPLHERQEELVGLPVLGVASAPALGHANETHRLGLSSRRTDKAERYTVFDKIQLRDGQAAVVVSPMVGKFDFNSRDNAMG